MMDYILNGQAHGSVAAQLMASNMDPRILRPWLGRDGRTYIDGPLTVNEKGELKSKPIVANTASAVMRKDDWVYMDAAIMKAAKPRLRFVADLRSNPSTQFTIPNGMSKTSLEHEAQSDISEATISMDGLRKSQSDRPVFDLRNLPLPIIHKDFEFPIRQLMASRNGGSPLDTTTGELAGRRVAELVEQLALGIASSYAYGGGTIYGVTNYPSRMTKSMTLPTAGGWTPKTTLTEVLQMKAQSQAQYHYGPWMVYTSPNWDTYLDGDYSEAKGDNTLRKRIKDIDGIQDVRTLDYLTGYTLILVQMTSDVIREVVGMDFTTVQWESQGGMQVNFKVMCIMVPQLRADYNGNTGVVHGTAV